MNLTDFIGDVDISTIDGIDAALAILSIKEEQINENLNVILSKQCDLDTKISNLSRTLTNVSKVDADSKKLSVQISHTSDLADSVSAKVRRLDEARSRASECQKRVHDLIDLQLCSQGVNTAIKEDDFEKGAGYVSRFLSMDKNLLQRTADDVQGNEDLYSVASSVKNLEEGAEKLTELVNVKFDEAVKKDDLASVERFFKIFPLLGNHGNGIEKFSSYICMKLSSKSQKELRNSLDLAKAEKRLHLAFADTLTTLLENFAKVIEVNQPIVEGCYGNGYLLPMLEVLQKECDSEVKNLILEFNKNRRITHRVNQINDYIKSGNSSNTSQTLGHYRNASGGGSIDKLNPKDIDAIIGEITVMHSRVELYFKFMRRRITNDLEASEMDDKEKEIQLAKLETMFSKSMLNRSMQEMLSTYLLFERYFMEESALKAIQLDAYETGQLTSSMIDDVFFIIRKSIRRSVTTQSMNGICAVINNAASCLDGDFVQALKGPLKAGYPSGYIDLAQAYNAIQSSIQQGKIQTNDTEQARTNFLVQLNNADMATEYIETLWTSMEGEIQAHFPQMSKLENNILESCITELKSVKDSLKAVVDLGLQQLKSSAIKPRLNQWIDQFLTYNHHLTEEELALYEAGETFVQFLIVQIDGLLNQFKKTLSSRNYDALVSILASEITTRMERVIKKSTFNRLGGLILDQEIRALGAYLTSATSWSIRDKMTRLTQIVTLLNLEKVSEFSEYFNPNDSSSDSPAWRITPSEIKQILTLRIDFRMEDIKRIKL